MKYILFTVIGLAIVFGICFLVSGLIRRKMKKKLSAIVAFAKGLWTQI